MTKRAVLLGLVFGAAICGLSYLNANVLRQTPLIGNSLPLAVYGGLIIVTIGINPLLRRHGMTGKELAVILAMTLAASTIPGTMRTFLPAVVAPHQIERVRPGWKNTKVMDDLPKKMLVDVPDEAAHDEVVSKFVMGLNNGQAGVSLGDLPWAAWSRTLRFWVPLILTLWIALIGLSLVIHRQWSEHERLPYPIASFTSALLPGADGKSPEFLRNRMFWVGAGIVFLIHMNNYFVAWFPDVAVRIPTTLDFTPLAEVLPALGAGGGRGLLNVHVYFVVIGLAYFIPKEASLSFGIGPFLWYLLLGLLIGSGINLTASQGGTSYFSLNPQSFALFGANVGVFAMIIYNGRQFYASTAGRALGLSVNSEIDSDSVSIFGFRLFAIATVLLLVQLMLVGVELVIAIPYVLMMIIGFVVMGRIIAETGLIYMKCYFWPCVILWGVLGIRVVGPQQMLVLMMLSLVLFLDPREALLPFMTNSLKVLQQQKVNLRKPVIWCCAALVLGIAVAIPTDLYLNYRNGNTDGWSMQVPAGPFETGTMIRNRLKSTGITVDEESSALARLTDWTPNWTCVGVGVAGLVLVIACSVASLRLRNWPLHPLMFVTWASTPLRLMGASFLIGWAIKVVVVRYGGAGVYNKMKPVMYGLIAGEILGGVLPILIGTGYYLVTGDFPKSFRILP